jgi:hypothetical protein
MTNPKITGAAERYAGRAGGQPVACVVPFIYWPSLQRCQKAGRSAGSRAVCVQIARWLTAAGSTAGSAAAAKYLREYRMLVSESRPAVSESRGRAGRIDRRADQIWPGTRHPACRHAGMGKNGGTCSSSWYGMYLRQKLGSSSAQYPAPGGGRVSPDVSTLIGM